MECQDCPRILPISSRYVRCRQCRLARRQTEPSRNCRHCGHPFINDGGNSVRCDNCRELIATATHRRLLSTPLAYISSTRPRQALELRRMNVSCPLCSALHWKAESTASNVNGDLLFESCCKKGAVALDPLPSPPPLLQYLLQSNSNDAINFRSHIRSYNSALCYTSFAHRPDPRLEPYEHNYIFQLQGTVYHYQGPLEYSARGTPSYSQLFFLDPNDATAVRQGRDSNSALNSVLLRSLDLLLRAENHYSELYYRAHEILNRHSDLSCLRLNPQLRLVPNANEDPRRYNLPAINSELAVLIPDIPGEYGSPSFRDILLYRRSVPGSTGDGEHFLTKIHPNHALYLPLHYVLFYPTGGRGFHQGLRLSNDSNLTARMFYRFHLHTRLNPFQSLHRGRSLFQQFIVDAWASTEGLDLDYLRYNQTQLRADRYNNTYSAILANRSPEDIGRRIIFPSSFVGGDRFMQRLYQDSMAIVRHFGKPALFITFTTNPEWDEITRELLTDENGVPMQTWRDRPDLVSRVFNLKLRELLKELRADNIFGNHVASVYTVEFQKRGLPHAHILLFLDGESQFDTPEKIDQIISAELPDPRTDLELYNIITKFMIHGPCEGNNKARCMKESGSRIRCSKSFPRPYVHETTIDDHNYPSYRRRANAFTATVKHPLRRGETITVGNEWIVPYNPYLTKKYNAHINVEVCGTIRAIRYIHKYIYKGSDRATMELDSSMDEIRQYVNCRYLGSSEGIWKLFEFAIHGELPPVKQLPVHLPGQHFISFDCATPSDNIMSTIIDKRTPLMAFIDYNAAHPESQPYLYQDFPQHFTWNSKDQTWNPRRRGIQIGRMYQANPFQGELYYLRCLLNVVPGPVSFEALRSVDNVLHPSFESACRARGILSSDSNWDLCFQEAKDMRTGWYLRRLLISAMLYGGLSDASRIWNSFSTYICDDLPRELRRRDLHWTPSIERPEVDYGLYLISRELAHEDRSLRDFHLPPFLNDWGREQGNPLLRQELDYDFHSLDASASAREASLNGDQRLAYDTILHSIDSNPTETLFFLHGSGDTGKTFLYITLCERLRAQGKIVLCVASTGIASLLLPGGRTAHKRFKIPINVSEDSTCFIRRGTQLADLLCQTSLIIWDEAPMTNRVIYDAVDTTLKDIRSYLPGGDSTFGGIPTVFGGDFQQILPVVRHGNRADSVGSCLQYAKFWPKISHLQLRQNMRLSNATGANRSFGEWLQAISFDPAMIGAIKIPDYIHRTSTDSDFLDRIYPEDVLRHAPNNPGVFIGRAILCTRNPDVDGINIILLKRILGETYTFDSFDQADLNHNALGREDMTAEYLRSINVAALPLGSLQLRIGCPMMLMRNLDPQHGLCNGTRMTLLRASRHCLEVRLNGGEFDGQIRLIYRCSLSTNEDLSFELTRTQFPVRLAFAMTINKSQGQSLEHVGLDLRRQVFTHGQLYVALSRTTDVRRLSILLSTDNVEEKIRNVVYPEVLAFLG